MGVIEAGDVARALGAIGAAVAMAWGLAAWIRVQLLPWLRRTTVGQAMSALPHVARLGEDVRVIRDQVLPNGGSSLRDSVARTETMVRDVLAMTRANADAAPDGHVDVDALGRWTWANATLCRWLGIDQDRLLGWGWQNAVIFEQRQDLRAEWEAAIRERREMARPVRMRPTDMPDPIPCDWTLRPISVDQEGVPRAWRLHVRRRDLTQRLVAIQTDEARNAR